MAWMKSVYKKISLTCLLSCLISLFVPFVYASEDESQKELTVMIYMCGSNLESSNGAATSDISEMLKSRYNTEKVNVLAMVGGSTSWRSAFSAEETAIYEIAGLRPTKVYGDELLNMGEADTLTTLLNFGYENYPSDEYALILWDHGGGPLRGVCWDSLSKSDNLTLEELDSALENSFVAEKRLSWIGFDACLMASIEVADQMAPYADYMIASQETEPSTGWNYEFLKGIEEDASALQTGTRIVDCFIDHTEENRNHLTCSVFDLSQLTEVITDMDTFFSNITLDVDNYSELANNREEAPGFGRADLSGNDYDLVDLRTLIDSYASQNPEEAAALNASLEKVIVYSRSTIETSRGVSIYHPFYNKTKYQKEWGELYPDLFECEGYTGYIAQFAKIWLGEKLSAWSNIPTYEYSDYSGEFKKIYTLLTEEQRDNLAHAELLVLADDGKNGTSLYSVYTSTDVTDDGNGQFACDYMGEAIYLYDEEGKPEIGPIPYSVIDDQYCFYVTFRNEETDEGLHVLYYFDMDINTGDVNILYYEIYDKETQAYTNRLTFDPLDYDYYVFPLLDYTPTYDGDTLLGFIKWEESGAMLAQPGKETSNLDWDLRVAFDQLSSTQLYATFQITDTQNNIYSSELIPLTNKNLREVEIADRIISRDGSDVSDSLDYTFKAAYNDVAINPSLTVDVRIAKDESDSKEYRLDDTYLMINDEYLLGTHEYYTNSLPIQGDDQTEDVFSLLLDLEKINYIQHLSSITFIIQGTNPENPEDIENIIVELYFDLDLSDSRGRPAEVASKTEFEGCNLELFNLKQDEKGNIHGMISCTNCTERNVAFYADQVVLNGIVLELSNSVYINTLPGTVQQTEFCIQNKYSHQFIMESKQHLIIRNPIGKTGNATIEQLTFYPEMMDDTEKKETFSFTLEQPLKVKPSTDFESNFMDRQDALKAYEDDALEIKIKAIYTYQNHLTLCMMFRNKTREKVFFGTNHIYLNDVCVSGIDCFGSDLTVLPEAEMVHYMDIRIDDLELEYGMDYLGLEDGIDSITIGFDREEELQSVRINLEKALFFDENQGEIILPDQLSSEMARKEEGLPFIDSEIDLPDDLDSYQKHMGFKLPGDPSQYKDGSVLIRVLRELNTEEMEKIELSDESRERYVNAKRILNLLRPEVDENGCVMCDYSGLYLTLSDDTFTMETCVDESMDNDSCHWNIWYLNPYAQEFTRFGFSASSSMIDIDFSQREGTQIKYELTGSGLYQDFDISNWPITSFYRIENIYYDLLTEENDETSGNLVMTKCSYEDPVVPLRAELHPVEEIMEDAYVSIIVNNAEGERIIDVIYPYAEIQGIIEIQ